MNYCSNAIPCPHLYRSAGRERKDVKIAQRSNIAKLCSRVVGKALSSSCQREEPHGVMLITPKAQYCQRPSYRPKEIAFVCLDVAKNHTKHQHIRICSIASVRVRPSVQKLTQQRRQAALESWEGPGSFLRNETNSSRDSGESQAQPVPSTETAETTWDHSTESVGPPGGHLRGGCPHWHRQKLMVNRAASRSRPKGIPC